MPCSKWPDEIIQGSVHVLKGKNLEHYNAVWNNGNWNLGLWGNFSHQTVVAAEMEYIGPAPNSYVKVPKTIFNEIKNG